ncbi:Winged helix-turn-helix DNA-binding [Halomicrobium zhouii]|uniref:Winged helix-turn-helix DNA-binding n=1 Tax=Halomicrobium zhouii TaxID=767519 RepID=A0A1I6KI43_9EURY|nr:winged helix-turn-helix domain-containing protein [Halomicrobium zhouii]SFR90866.1 Winged helix-turn-helix DNA-binding [Halomicrobium zhouii]
MSRKTWHRPRDATRHGRDATLSQVIEAVDRTAPATKADLADAVGISEQYVSELLQELKRDGVVRKAYVVDDAAVFDAADSVSEFFETAADAASENGRRATGTDRGTTVLELLERLDDVTSTQYEAARLAFVGDSPDHPADGLESLTNERYFAVLGELKSYTLTTDWPGNRVASDLATIATNLEIVGDRSCFIADVVDRQDTETTGVVEERILDVFEAGSRINGYLVDVLFEGDLEAYDALHAEEETVHRDLDELFELVTAYDPELYGHLVTVTRALERAIYYWVDAAEIAVRLHSGIEADHAMI